MAPSHYQLLCNCSDDQLREICQRRKLPVPQYWQEGVEGRMRLLKTMVFHLEDNKQLTNTLLDLDGRKLSALKALSEEGRQPEPEFQAELLALGLILPDGEGWAVPGRVADALADFDDSAFCFQAGADVAFLPAPAFGLAAPPPETA